MLAADPSQPARCVGADLLSGLYVNRDNTGGTGWGCRSTVDNRGVFPAPRRSLAWIIAKRGPGMVGTAIGGCAWRQRRVWPGCGPCFAVRRSANRTERICHSPHNCPTPRLFRPPLKSTFVLRGSLGDHATSSLRLKLITVGIKHNCNTRLD